MKAALAVLLVPLNPLMGCRAGNTETIGELGDRVLVQLIVFEESLPLFAHGNTFPGHGRHLLAEGSVTYVPEWFTRSMLSITP